jgi:hypothetical protein
MVTNSWFCRRSWNDFCWHCFEVRERRSDKGSPNMLIKILLLTILVGSIALSAHIPAWGDLAKRKGS